MLGGTDRLDCAYGENAWQAPAAFIAAPDDDPLALGCFTLVEGAALSYKNLVEVDRQLQTITHRRRAGPGVGPRADRAGHQARQRLRCSGRLNAGDRGRAHGDR